MRYLKDSRVAVTVTKTPQRPTVVGGLWLKLHMHAESARSDASECNAEVNTGYESSADRKLSGAARSDCAASTAILS
jgi:hypothetical protein